MEGWLVTIYTIVVAISVAIGLMELTHKRSSHTKVRKHLKKVDSESSKKRK